MNFQMVGVVNPSSTQTLAAQVEAAKSADFAVAPGEPVPGEGTPSGVNGATSTSTFSSNSTASRGPSTGLIIGLSVGGGVIVALCAALFFFVGRSKNWKEIVQRHDKRRDDDEMMKPVGVQSPQMNCAYLPPQSPQSPYSPSMGHGDFLSPLPPYASRRPYTAHMDVKSGGGMNGQQWSMSVPT